MMPTGSETLPQEWRVANIPPKSNRSDPICFSPYLYRARNLVERFFNKIKHCRGAPPQHYFHFHAVSFDPNSRNANRSLPTANLSLEAAAAKFHERIFGAQRLTRPLPVRASPLGRQRLERPRKKPHSALFLARTTKIFATAEFVVGPAGFEPATKRL